MDDRTRALRIWLYIVAALIGIMVIVGGATRLTEAGLSITEWRPITGIIPPLTIADWQQEFVKYQEIPQYKLVNDQMTLVEFKTIYWWEWAHRALGRFIGLVFFLPFIWFWMRGQIDRRLGFKLVVVMAIGSLQGIAGWYMVMSGLSDRIDVSQYRLALHLFLACLLYALIISIAYDLRPNRHMQSSNTGRTMADYLLLLIFAQITFGAFVAGIDAGYIYNSWPLMADKLIPDGLFTLSPIWHNLFENQLTVQFIHRLIAYLLITVALLNAVYIGRNSYNRRHISNGWALFIVIGLQAVLGITTLLFVTPKYLALAHQAGALVVLAMAVYHRSDYKTAPPLMT